MFQVHGPSTAVSPPSLPDLTRSFCLLEDRWALPMQVSLRHYANHRQYSKVASTRSTTITSRDPDQDQLTGSRRWPARCTPTPSQDESSHAPQDNLCMCGAGGHVVARDCLDVAVGQ